MRINNEVIINVPTILSSPYYSRAIYLGHVTQYSISATFTGTFTGTFSLEVSNDISHPQSQSISTQVSDIINWTHVDASDVSTTDSGNVTWSDENVGYAWVRLKYISSSGTCTLAKLCANTKGS